MAFSYRELLEFAWKLNCVRWNPLATTAVVPFVMLIRTILIPNLDCFDGERNAFLVSEDWTETEMRTETEAQRLRWVRG